MGSNKLFLPLVLLSSSWVFMGYSQDPLAGLLSSLSNVAGGSDAAAAGLGAAGFPLGNAATSMACAQKIIPCRDFLKPPSSPTDACCAPLKQMIHKDPKCLCNIFNNDELLKTFGVTQHEALKLLIECGTKDDIRQCNNTASASAPAPAGSANPASPSPNTSTTPTGASDGDSAALLSALNGVLNRTNGTAVPAPASKNSANSEKISLFGGFGFMALFTFFSLSA